MNSLMFSRRLKAFFQKMFRKIDQFLEDIFFPKRKRPVISLLIPFSSKDPLRRKNFKWLLSYWKNELPEAEIVIGKSKSKIFCKGEALNHAARKAKGKIFVILDADAYMEGRVLTQCANEIIESLQNGFPLWYVPYRNLYRLKEGITKAIVSSPPKTPLRVGHPPNPNLVEEEGIKRRYGHRYGAMCMMFPREAYELINNFDERFQGWGGEDVALLRMLDTLYAKHKSVEEDIFHLWHPFFGDTYETRKWVNQQSGSINWPLAKSYNRAIRFPSRMEEIKQDSIHYYKHRKHRRKLF